MLRFLKLFSISNYTNGISITMDGVSQTQTDVNPSATAQKTISGGVPNFIRLDSIPVNYIQQVETDLLEPVVFNDPSVGDGFCRFTLQNKGFLHSSSKLFLSLVPPAGNASAIPPLSVGIGAVIKKAVLKVGNQNLNEISEWQNLHAVKSSLIANELNKEREQYLTGRGVSHRFKYDATGTKAGRQAKHIVVDNGVEVGGAGNLEALDCLNMDGTSPTTLTESPSYAVDLSDLFPFLKTHQLPLYMIDQPINIELTFAPQSKFRAVVDSAGADANSNYSIDRNEVKFCADYIFYGAGDEMEQYKQANQDMTFSFVDYRLNSASLPTMTGAGGTPIVRNLGMANRMVTRVITCFSAEDGDPDNLLGGYASFAPLKTAVVAGPPVTGGIVGPFKYNLRYNDRFEFASDVDNSARLFSLLTDAESVPFITREEFSHEGSVLSTTETYLGRAIGGNGETGLAGGFFYNSTRLTGGRVGHRGIELHITGQMPAKAKILKSYCEYLRVARLRNGNFEIFNA